MRRFGILLTTLATAAAAWWSTPALAVQSVSMRLSNGNTNTCHVTALPARMTNTRTKAMATSASIWCTQAATVTVTIGAVEMDGSIEDRVQAADRSYIVTVRASTNPTRPTAVTVSGPSFTCVSTEVDNEEIATTARVALSSSVVSAVDRSAPANNEHPC